MSNAPYDGPGGPYHHNPDVQRNLERFPRVPEQPEAAPEVEHDGKLKLIAAVIFMVLVLGLNEILPGEGTILTVQILGYASAISVLSYIWNNIAIKKLTILAARGDKDALYVSLVFYAVFFVLIGTIAFAGSAHKMAADIDEREHGQDVQQVFAQIERTSQSADRIVSILQSARNDGRAIVRCELSQGCGSGKAGRGVVVSQLEQLDARYASLIEGFGQGAAKRKRLIERLRTATKAFEARLNNRAAQDGDRRAALLEVNNNLRGLIAQLGEAMPITAALSFAKELRQIAPSFPHSGRINVGAKLVGHADNIETTVGGIGTASYTIKPFPAPPNITAGWSHIDIMWPLAILSYLLEFAAVALWYSVYRQYVAFFEVHGRTGHSPDGNGPPPATSLTAQDDQPQLPLIGGTNVRALRSNPSTLDVLADKHGRR